MLMGAGIKWLLVGVLGAGAAGFVVMQGTPAAPAAPKTAKSGLPIETITLGGRPFELEVAATPKAVERGMSGRTEIADGTGMIFVFPESRILSFWMIDCLIDIDVAYLDRTGKVVSTYTMKTEAPQKPGESREAYTSRLRRYPSAEDAIFAIEVKAGLLEKLGVRPGSTVKVDYAKLRRYLRAN
ncbi:MAG: DUF192 domain-containing protein [Phycisphaerales bacterium]|jgi:uncharacterized membrane protein (UPF0127 family)